MEMEAGGPCSRLCEPPKFTAFTWLARARGAARVFSPFFCFQSSPLSHLKANSLQMGSGLGR